MNDDGLKDKLVTTEESPTLTKVGKEIVGAAIKDDQGVVNSGKIAEMLKEIKDLDTAGSVCAAVVDYLIGCDDVTADILNQLLGNESLSGILVTSGDSPTLTEAGKKIVGAAIKDNGTVTSENIVQMLNGLDLKEKVGAAVVNYLIDRNDVTADMLYQLMDDGDLIAKLVEQSGDNAGKLTEVGQKIMNKATEKGLTFAQLFNISQSNPKLEFSYNDDKKSFNIKDRKLIITNLPKTMFYYLQQQQQQQGKDLTLETILFKQYLNEDGIKEYIDESGELKSLGDWDDSYANMDKQNSQVEYNPSELLVNHYVTLVKDSTDSEVKKALEDDASFALQTPTTLGQVLASQDIQDKLITKDTPQKLTEAGKAIVEAAIVYNVQPLSGSKQPSRENIVELLSNFGSFDENTVCAAVVDHLLGLADVTAEMLGQALNNDKLKAKFFNEPTSEGTTTYSLTPAGQHMIKQAAMTYDHDLFVKFVKSLDTENYIECIYETVASMKDDENNTRFQAYWLIAALIQDNSTEKTLKNKLHTIIQDNKGQHFNFSDLNCDDFTEDSQITEDGKLALILFANSKSSDFIGAAKEDTSLGFTSSTITINSFKFRYKIDGTNHTVYYSKK